MLSRIAIRQTNIQFVPLQAIAGVVDISPLHSLSERGQDSQQHTNNS
ncbi:hypothetical protein [uncultured Bacteroides sp.]|nr:hypothetical protein [uncultured Bacteroides sp.]